MNSQPQSTTEQPQDPTQDLKQTKRVTYLDCLNFIGSICSIAALLMVVLKDVNLIKGLNIMVALVFAFCCLGAVGPKLNACIRKKFTGRSTLICIYMVASLIIVFMSSLLFYGFYCAMEVLELNIVAMVKDL